MKKMLVSGAVAALFTLSMGAQAESPFNYIDYAIGTIDYDHTSSNGDYSSFSASFETPIAPFILVESTDYNGYDELVVGAGTFGDLGSSSHIYGIIHYVSTDGENNDDEIRLTAGIRSSLADRLEFGAKIRNDITDDNAENVYKLSLNYYLTRNLSFAGNYEIFDSVDILSASARFSF